MNFFSCRLLNSCAAALVCLALEAVSAHAQDPVAFVQTQPLSGAQPDEAARESMPMLHDRARQAGGTLRLRFPDVCKSSVVFTYAGDLWMSSTQGGAAIRLTSGPGLKRGGRFSPDCTRIAFTGQYDGDDQVYVIDATGGTPRQLTYYPAPVVADYLGFDNQVYDWSPDGKRILFRSYRDGWAVRRPRLYSIAVAGGTPQALPMPMAGTGRYAPNGQQVVFTPLFRDFKYWTRYHGGLAQALYIYDFQRGDAQRITNDRFSDRDPIWVGDAIYYVSERDDHGNLYRYDVRTGNTTQLTHHQDGDVRWASGDAKGNIVYEFAGGLRLYDAAQGTERALDIQVPSDLVTQRPSIRDVAARIESTALSPNGKRALVTARGEIFDVALREGSTLNLTNAAGVHRREATWSSDGRRIAYISDESGEEAIWMGEPGNGTAPRKLTQTPYGRLYAPRWSPDGKWIAFTDQDDRLRLVDTASERIVEVAASPHILERDVGRDYSWSPNGRYLAYTLEADNLLPAIHVYDTKNGKSTRVSPEPFAADTPVFSPDGQYLYFLSAREWAPQLSSVEWEFSTDRTEGIYALVLHKGGAAPFPIRDDQGSDDPAAAARGSHGMRAAHSAVMEDRIDFDDMAQRIVRAPLDPGNYANLSVTRDALLYTVGDGPYYGRDGAFPTKLVRYDTHTRSEKTLAQSKALSSGYVLSADGRFALYHDDGQRYKLIDVERAGTADDIKFEHLYALVDPTAEYAEIFREVWRRYRDYFYAKNMHGYDWIALRKKYEAQLPFVADRTELNYLMGQMAAELDTSHVYISGGDTGAPVPSNACLLGATFAADPASGRYRIEHILAGDNAEARYRSPLTEYGINVHEGDYLLSVNGRALTTAENPYRLLHCAPGQTMRIAVSEHPSEREARTVTVRPIDSERNLRYFAWAEHNREYVARKSGGQIGYLHLPNTFADGIREFIKWYYPQIHKQALIIDMRGNGGGNTSEMIIERLSRKLLGLGYWRNFDRPDTYPQQVFLGSLATLVDGTTSSDGDTFAYMFKQAKLGPVIGTRTWGGVVGFDDWGPVIDGGTVDVPQYFATANTNGQFEVEGEGVTPDIEVPVDIKAAARGDDAQLDQALDYLLRRVRTHTASLPNRPPDPVGAPADLIAPRYAGSGQARPNPVQSRGTHDERASDSTEHSKRAPTLSPVALKE